MQTVRFHFFAGAYPKQSKKQSKLCTSRAGLCHCLCAHSKSRKQPPCVTHWELSRNSRNLGRADSSGNGNHSLVADTIVLYSCLRVIWGYVCLMCGLLTPSQKNKVQWYWFAYGGLPLATSLCQRVCCCRRLVDLLNVAALKSDFKYKCH